MTETEVEARAAVTRAEMLAIWDGDAAKSDAFLCRIMEWWKTALIAEGRSPEQIERAMRLAAMLIQR